MPFLFGSRARDVEQLRQTLPHLTPSTTIAALAAALSWNDRRAEKAVREWERLEPMRVAYDPLTRSVRLLRPAALSVEPTAAPTPTAAPAAAAPPTALPRAFREVVNCRSCGTAMEPTGTGSGLFCPACGRLSSGHHAAAPPPLPAPPAPTPRPVVAPPPPTGANGPSVATGTGHSLSDRKAQEMFAAWATAQPIPCPRCRTPLRHHGVGEYRCPGCGETARFVGESAEPVAPRTPLAPPAA
ncbi:MAG TPA: hypothetical protein VGP88_06440 [Thermoplasmata archaeon]|jgi:predicted RNA-binding Zn-ribbon protein involved in translation (DUF1610 family)|nr:hypothetical protein [Thermoplasmata archaeon]